MVGIAPGRARSGPRPNDGPWVIPTGRSGAAIMACVYIFLFAAAASFSSGLEMATRDAIRRAR